MKNVKKLAQLLSALVLVAIVFSCTKDKDEDPVTPGEESNKPIAAFVASTSSISEGETVDFTDKSTNTPTSWTWDFGDGNTSTLQNPSNKYETEGTFAVSLVATNADGSDTENKASFITVSAPAGEMVTDYDGNSYQTIEIGTQTWMKENLKVTHYPDGTAIPYVTDNAAWVDLGDNNDDDAYCFYNNNLNNEEETYGALYTWAAAMGGTGWSSNTNPSGVQGVCPDGWHLPSRNEWLQLLDFLGGRMVSGGKMKEAGTSHWLSPNTGADNSSGFTGIPSGYRSYTGDAEFNNLGEAAIYWSATEYDGSRSYYSRLRYNYVQGSDGSNKNSTGYSVRCVKN
ncbi:MAG: PKD domain-containing protein [Bacteroidales bacterium]|nr:PKD domain-containing protein [Bacteroidales bacterium]